MKKLNIVKLILFILFFIAVTGVAIYNLSTKGTVEVMNVVAIVFDFITICFTIHDLIKA